MGGIKTITRSNGEIRVSFSKEDSSRYLAWEELNCMTQTGGLWNPWNKDHTDTEWAWCASEEHVMIRFLVGK